MDSLFDRTITAIVEDLAKRGNGMLAAQTEINAPQSGNIVNKSPINQAKPSVTAPSKNLFKANTAKQTNTDDIQLYDVDGTTPIANPETGEPLMINKKMAQANPQEYMHQLEPMLKKMNPEQQNHIYGLVSQIFEPQQ